MTSCFCPITASVQQQQQQQRRVREELRSGSADEALLFPRDLQTSPEPDSLSSNQLQAERRRQEVVVVGNLFALY